jgi:hypothetical protein
MQRGPNFMPQTNSKTGRSLVSPELVGELGHNVEYAPKGKKPTVAAEKKRSKLSRLKPMPILPPGTTIEDVDAALKIASEEASAAWERQRI